MLLLVRCLEVRVIVRGLAISSFSVCGAMLLSGISFILVFIMRKLVGWEMDRIIFRYSMIF